MNFGKALEKVKFGAKAARAAWNGKAHIFIEKGSIDPFTIKEGSFSPDPSVRTMLLSNGFTAQLFEKGDVGTTTRLPMISMAREGEPNLPGWTPSQEDMLIEDWEVVP